MSPLYVDGVKKDAWIKELRVTNFAGVEEVHRVGEYSVFKITYSAGTSGTEYLVELTNGDIIQYRGYYQYDALWGVN